MAIFKKVYRIQHQRCYGAEPFVLLQNRVLEAETAEQALRLAMASKDVAIEVRSDDLALLDKSSPSSYFDFWRAELDELSIL
jgi:hypothetical protein